MGIEINNINIIRKTLDDFEDFKNKNIELKETKYDDGRYYQLGCKISFYNHKKINPNKIYKVLMPSGTGKTYTTYLIISDDLKINPNNKHIIFVPSKDLAYQTLNLYKKFNIKSCIIGNGNKNIEDDTNVIVCINNSARHIPKDMKFKYKILDEAHHLEIINKDNKTYRNIIMDDIQAEDTLAFSATYHNLDDVNYTYSEAEAIEKGYITDYMINVNYFTDGDKTKGLVKLVKENVGLWSPMFVYFNSNQKSEKFNNLLLDEGINSVCINGNTPVNIRIKYKQQIEDELIDVVVLCGCYNEGISIDNIQTIIFADMRYSYINKNQIRARGSRLHYKKPYYRVVLPLIKDDLNNDDLKNLIVGFSKIDNRLSDEIKNKDYSRINIKIHNNDSNENEIEELNDSEYLYEEIYDKFGNFIKLTRLESINLIAKYYIEFGQLSSTKKLPDNSNNYSDKWYKLKTNLTPKELEFIFKKYPLFFENKIKKYNKIIKSKLSRKDYLKQIILHSKENKYNLSKTKKLSDDSSTFYNKWRNLKNNLTDDDKNFIKNLDLIFYRRYIKKFTKKEYLKQIILHSKENEYKLSRTHRISDYSNTFDGKWGVLKKNLTNDDKNFIKNLDLIFYKKYLKKIKKKLSRKEYLKQIILHSKKNEYNYFSKTEKLSDDSSTFYSKWINLKKNLTDDNKNFIKNLDLIFYKIYIKKFTKKEYLKQIILHSKEK